MNYFRGAPSKLVGDKHDPVLDYAPQPITPIKSLLSFHSINGNSIVSADLGAVGGILKWFNKFQLIHHFADDHDTGPYGRDVGCIWTEV